MTIISLKTGTGPEFRRIELSDGSFFSFNVCYLPSAFAEGDWYSPGCAEGRELEAGEDQALRFASACLRAEKAALRLIARAEQTVFGLSRKLERRGHDSACVRSVVSRLADLRLVDDERFARLWLESRLGRRTASPRRFLAALRGRGIDRVDAEKAVKAVLDDETEWRLLIQYTEKKKLAAGKPPKTAWSAASRNVASRYAPYSLKFFLKSEGFSTALIRRFLEEQEE